VIRIRHALALCIALALAGGTAARAELWGYVDEAGVAHFATEKRDDRYQLFFKGATSLDPPDAAALAEAQARDAFMRTALFQRVAHHPNLRRFEPLIEQQAKAHNLDPALVKAVIAVESSFEPGAVSPKGALGLMQVIPETGARYGVTGDRKRSLEQKLLDPAVNLRVGTRYLRDLLALFANDLNLALAAYNAGEQAVQRHGNAIPPFPETKEYVKLVQQFHALYRPPPPAERKPVRIVIPGKRAPPAPLHAVAQ
jgi:soluble lytic murein transglycosylase-like protein